MAIDPDEELKREIKKRAEAMQAIQRYMEEQDALDDKNKIGKLGSHAVKKNDFSTEIPSNLLKFFNFPQKN